MKWLICASDVTRGLEGQSSSAAVQPLTLRRRGVQRVVQAPTGAHDVTLLEGMARAFYWQSLIDAGDVGSDG